MGRTLEFRELVGIASVCLDGGVGVTKAMLSISVYHMYWWKNGKDAGG